MMGFSLFRVVRNGLSHRFRAYRHPPCRRSVVLLCQQEMDNSGAPS
jgi:hypothetical protein